jgi:cytochrome c556
MRLTSKTSLLAAAYAALIASAAIAATSEENLAAYKKRDGTMKQIGRNFYVGIGRVVQGRNPYGPQTVTAAETVTKLVAELPALFPPGSDVPESKMNPAILTATTDREALIAQVQQAAVGLVPAVKEGAENKDVMASVYKAVNDACTACHKKYRYEKEE